MKRRVSKSTKFSLIYIVLSGMILFGYVNCAPVHEMAETATNSSGNPPGYGQTFYTCNSSVIGNNSSIRLSKREYENTIRDLTGLINAGLFDVTVQDLLTSLPNDEISGKENTTLVFPSHINAYLEIGYHLGTRIAASYLGSLPGTNGCMSNATVTDACLTSFVNEFGLRTFRRPLTAAETTLYKSHYNSSSFTGKVDKVTAVIAIFLQSPDFLYRIYDQGIVNPQFSNTRLLTDYELASKISYLINGTMPDSTLFGKAANGTLQSADGLRIEVERLLQKTSARTTLNRFFIEWLKYNQFQNFSDFPTSVLNGINISGLPQAMTQEIDSTISHVVFNENGRFQDLMTTNRSSVSHAGLASIYGVSNGATSLTNDRLGILSRAAFLSRKPANLTSPARRGHFILSEVLCDHISNPPPGAPTQVDPLPPGQFFTTRDRTHFLTIESHGGAPITSCMGCHTRMNPFGYNYESFDPIGRLRPNNSEVVNGTINGQPTTQVLPLNTVAETYDLNGYLETLHGYQGLHQKLAVNPKALRCMTEKWFDYVQKRALASTDYCYANEVLETVYGTDEAGQGTIQDMIKKTILSDRFKYWKHQ